MQIYNNTLTANSVSIKSDEFGMRAYVNSIRGRTQLESECPTEIVQEVYQVWGDSQTVIESEYHEPPINTGFSETEQLRADVDYLSLMIGVELT